MTTTRAAALAPILALALLIGAAPASASAQGSSPAPPIGADVKDVKGAAVGKVEKIILGPDGRPRQALVRVDGVLRALPVEALQRAGQAYAAVLSRAEITALPPAE